VGSEFHLNQNPPRSRPQGAGPNFKFPRHYRVRILPAYRLGSTEAAGDWEVDMRYLAMAAAGICLLAMSAIAGVGPALAAGVDEAKSLIMLG